MNKPNMRASIIRAVSEFAPTGEPATTANLAGWLGVDTPDGRKNISNQLGACARDGYLSAKKNTELKALAYKLTKEGKNYLADVGERAWPPEEIAVFIANNSGPKRTGKKRVSAPVQPMVPPIDYGQEAKQAIDSIASLVDENAKLREIIKNIMKQCERVIAATEEPKQ